MLPGVELLEIIVSFFVYPGLLLALVLALLFGWLTYGRRFFGRLRGVAFWRSFDGLAAVGSIALAALALALLPWPYHPAAGWRWIGSPIALWAALEVAFLTPLLPGLLAPAPLGARAASREAQMGLAGRFVFWIALGVALWLGAGWSWLALPGRLLATIAGFMALPAAIGAGPFAAERSLSTAGAEEGLDEAPAGLVRFARTLRGGVLLAALLVASLPLTGGLWASPLGSATVALQPWAALLIAAALFVLVALLMRRLSAIWPRLPLPAALRWCWWRALPLAVAALVYLIIV
jgi:hypothetical protein